MPKYNVIVKHMQMYSMDIEADNETEAKLIADEHYLLDTDSTTIVDEWPVEFDIEEID
jgi:hypothetical protein